MPAKLGQHFLINKSALKKIAESLEIKKNDLIIEVGAGHGELTEIIKQENSEIKIIAIEKDKTLVEFARKKFESDKKIKIIEGDALKEIKNQISQIKAVPNNKTKLNAKQTNQNPKIKNLLPNTENLKITGNIPYYITGYLFRALAELEPKPSLIVLTIQKEVAQRICAEPPKMNLLAASLQFWSKPKIISFIKKTSFNPQPKIDSAIIKLTTKNEKPGIKSESYYKLIKIIFKQPRKTILNNFAKGFKKQKGEIEKELKSLDVDPTLRPQNLSIEDLIKLAVYFNK